MFSRVILISTITLISLGIGTVTARANCPTIVFSPGATHRVIDGLAPADSTLCFELPAEIGQKISLKVLRGDNTIFSIMDVIDAEDHAAFTASRKSYEIIVAQLMRAGGPQHFKLAIDRTPAATAAASQATQPPQASPSTGGQADDEEIEDSGLDLYARDMGYQDLPDAAKSYVEAVRESCRENAEDSVPSDPMAGISQVFLPGDIPALVLDNETLCNSSYAGANCSNRGCDLEIMAKEGPSWKTVFKEHLYRSFLSVDDQGKLNLIAASIYAGDPRCAPEAGSKPMSSESCDVLIRYRDKQWQWQRVR